MRAQILHGKRRITTSHIRHSWDASAGIPLPGKVQGSGFLADSVILPPDITATPLPDSSTVPLS